MSRDSRPERRAVLRRLVAGVLALAVVCSAGTASGRETAGAPRENPGDEARPPVPVVLLHGAGGSPATWGVPTKGAAAAGRDGGVPAAAGPAGLYAALLGAGYRDGATLFVPDLRDRVAGDPMAAAGGWLAALVDEVRAASGARQVDLVAHGTMALAARYYAGDPRHAGSVRTLVMLAPPNAGSEAATALRLVALLEGAKGGPVADALRRGLGRTPVPEPDPEPVPFASEAEYVRVRAERYYYPLYRRYADTVDRRRPEAVALTTPGFDAWWEATDREAYRAATAGAQAPPFPGWGEADPWARPPDPAESLTLAYFEAEARALARMWHARAIANRGEWVLPDRDAVAGRLLGEFVQLLRDLRDLAAGGGVWAAVKAAFGRVLGDLAREGLLVLAGETAVAVAENVADDLGDAVVLGLARSWSGVRAPAGEAAWVAVPVLDRLVAETVPVGGRTGPRPVLANAFLRRWNAADAARRQPPAGPVRRRGATRLTGGTRYVVVAGQTLNAWVAADSSAPANDGLVSVAATVVPPVEFDAFALFASSLGTSHGLLPRHPAVVAFVRDSLLAEVPETAAHALGPSGLEGITGRASLWAPAVHRLEPAAGAPAELTVEVEVQRPQTGAGDGDRLVPSAWILAEAADGAWADRIPVTLARGGGGWRGAARLDGLGRTVGRAWVALRLVPADGSWAGLERWAAGPGPASGGFPGGYPAGPAWPYRFAVRPAGAAGSAGADRESAARPGDADRPPGRGTGGSGGPPEVSSDAPAGVARDGEPAGPPSGGGHPGSGREDRPGPPGGATAQEGAGQQGAVQPGGAPGGAMSKGAAPTGGGTGSPATSAEGPGERSKAPADITVVRRNRRTSYKQPQELAHARWRWSVDGGPEAVDGRPDRLEWTLEMPAGRAWTVRAAAEANTGKVLREGTWRFTPAGAGGRGGTSGGAGSVVLRMTSVQPPDVRVWIEGPVRWITGRPAHFAVHAAVADPPDPPAPGTPRAAVLAVEPSRTFTVTWLRAGRFTVTAAVTVKVSYAFPAEQGCGPVPGGELCYAFPERRTTAYNIYAAETAVDVLTTGLGD